MKRDIAIIGMSGKFPKSNNIEAFWQNLVEEKELIHFFSDKELEKKGVDKKEFNQPNYIKAVSFIEHTDSFDYPFFKYTLDEAKIMNPQTRMMHHLVWEALENAGCNIIQYTKKTGVFMGANKDLNWSIHASLKKGLHIDELTKAKLSNPNFMASLIAYKLNFKGPCYFIDTACSTSLSTAHLACRSLLLNECGIAVVGGIRLLSRTVFGYQYVANSIMSKDGHNKSFDRDSSGTIGSDGAGVVILKRLEEAIKDKDNIYAVIKGSAMNNDGEAKGGYTMPSVEGQSECIKLAHKIAGVSPKDITYIEAHGTGTKIGDPIEIEALNLAFNNNIEHKCALGTIKSNMGHADEAAGIIGLIKTAMSIKNKILPASLHYNNPNSTINFKEGPFYVNATTQPWKSVEGYPLTAGVSSLGIGGTNVHVILQETPVIERTKTRMEYKLIRYSAQSETALEHYEVKLLKFLENNKNIDIDNLAYTLLAGRRQFNIVKYLVVKSYDDLQHSLRNKKIFSTVVNKKDNIVFMFSGQGSQYVNMGKEIYNTYPLFKTVVKEGFEYLRALNGLDYYAILFSNENEFKGEINNTLYTQPILFVLEYALAQLLISLGIKPNRMIGHSLGEYVSATVSGVFTYRDALKIIEKRAYLMSKVSEGSMLSIAASVDQIKKETLKNVSIAAINTPDSFVISGTKKAINKVKKELDEEKCIYIELKTSHAFHSEMMNTMLSDFEKELKTITLQKPEIPFISNVSGDFITNEEATSTQYWSEHIVKTVNFEKGVKTLIERDSSLFIEVGPGRTLATFYKKCQNSNLTNGVVTTLRHPKENINDNEYFTGFLGELLSNGFNVNWNVYYGNNTPHKISIPTYAFDTYKIPSKVTIDNNILEAISSKNKKENITNTLYVPSWKRTYGSNRKGGTFSEAKKYILFKDNSDLCNTVIRTLKQTGNEVIEIFKGAQFEIKDNDKIVIRPNQIEDYQELKKHLKTIRYSYDFIIYAWELDPEKEPDLSRFSENSLTCNTILNIIKGFKLEAEVEPKKIVFITNRNNKILGTETPSNSCPFIEPLLHVLTQECEQVYATLLDLDLGKSCTSINKEIIKEFKNESKYNSVAYRNNRRWEPFYDVLDIEHIEDYRTALIKTQGNYLITGDLDDMEYILSKHLLNEYQANVILFSGVALYKWDEIKKKRYEKLKSLSGSFTCLYVDITNQQSLELEVEKVEKELGVIQGIIHMARNTEASNIGPVTNMSDQMLQKHLAPRVKGLFNLNTILEHRDIDFIKVISSLSSFLGGVSYGAYACASKLMDNVVLHKNDKKWSVLNLDRVHKENPWIAPEEFIQAFHYSFNLSGVPQIIVSKRDLDNPLGNLKTIEKPNSIVAINRRVIKTTFKAPRNKIELQVVTLFENLFGVKGLGIEDGFFELGGDSLKAVLLMNKLKSQLGIVLSMSDVFENKTILDLSELINQKESIAEDFKENKEIDSIII